MSINNAIASLAVKDLNSSLLWYEKLLGRPADSHPMTEVAEWKFERGGWLQVYQSPKNFGCNSVTLAVDNLQQQISELKRKGIGDGHPTLNEKVKVLMIKDPDGNSIALAEVIDQSLAH